MVCLVGREGENEVNEFFAFGHVRNHLFNNEFKYNVVNMSHGFCRNLSGVKICLA